MASAAPAKQDNPLWKASKPFVTGGISASMATVCIQPLDMVKVRLQLAEKGGPKLGPFKVASNIIKNEGIATFYSGISAAIFRQLTYGTTRLGVFSTVSKALTDENGHLSAQNRFAASFAAGGIGALVGTPADAALVRMQADTLLPANHPQRRNYKNVVDALARMAREEGLKGFFAGASPTVYRGLSINIGMLSTYDPYKRLVEQVISNEQLVHASAGFLSGATAATASLPFDFIKTRLQRQTKDPVTGELPYKNFFDCAVKTVRNEGPLSLYRGYLTYVFRIAPHITLTWVFLEALKKFDVFK